MKLSLPRILRQSIVHRPARSFAALIALTVSAAVATALLTLYADLDQKLHREFRSFGANIVLTEPTATPDLAAKGQQAAGPAATVAAFAYAVATTDRGTPVVIAGVDFAATRRLNAWWQVQQWPNGPNDVLLGQKAANFIADEHDVKLTFAGRTASFHGAGTLKTGSDEDARVYFPQAAFEAFTNLQPSVLEVQVPGGAHEVEAALARLKAAFPQANVQPVRQLVDGESRIVDRTHALMFAAVLLIALTVGVSVLATLSASVLERRRDFALMKALGGTQAQLMMLFLLETLLLATGGLVLGYMLGSALAWVISEANFHTASLPRTSVIPAVILLNVLIALLAALIPVRTLRSLEPAALLKGE